ncbi:hypothetical protein LPC08_12670 [Roseomonas sp. OT10]|uniref:hypothetical protein n=1 Tax=Roseomonas cutis TaxID=2897332 RepID=UPI001E5DFB8C|nr:hypothetical protein [Roseomonas sp. OT10]UFN46883.1 hypothetical protein LPC08_12670 [Roseomonas sp. OT10]
MSTAVTIGNLALQGIATLQALPVQIAFFAAGEGPDSGTPLDFPAGGEARDVPVPIPFLPGMEEVEVTEAAGAVGPRPIERTTNHAGPTGNGSSVTLSLTPPVAGAPVSLLRVEIQGFSLPAEGSAARVLRPDTGPDLSWPANSDRADPGSAGNPVYLLLSPADGPPFLATPAFPMPGSGAALYGNALGGGRLAATRQSDGRVDLVLTPTGAAALAALRLTVSRLPPDKPALPNEAQPVTWRATAIRAVWQLRPVALKVEAVAAGKAVTVAQLPGDPGQRFVPLDFAAAARGLTGPAYAAPAGNDLGLALRVTATGPGAARLRVDRLGVRYLRRPITRPERIALRGAVHSLPLAGAAGLRPVALDLAVQGKFLPERLTDASDDAPPQSRQGLLAQEGLRLARRTSLTEAERALPLVRLALFGRAAEPCELLATLHAGDTLRVGAPLAPPVALTLAPAADPAWHLAVLAAPILPPLPPVVWLVAQAGKGRFLWHGAVAEDDSALVSADAGGSWADGATRPAMQLAVREATATARPLPLRWEGGGASGLLAADLAGGAAPDFARRLLLAGDAAALLAALAQGPLTLSLACRRDVDLSVTEATLAYNPWTAREAAAA